MQAAGCEKYDIVAAAGDKPRSCWGPGHTRGLSCLVARQLGPPKRHLTMRKVGPSSCTVLSQPSHMRAQSYYGSLTCCAWSHDGRYVAAGGEDDLVAVFGLSERCVVAWGEGLSSFISAVAFDRRCFPPVGQKFGAGGTVLVVCGGGETGCLALLPFCRFSTTALDPKLSCSNEQQVNLHPS